MQTQNERSSRHSRNRWVTRINNQILRLGRELLSYAGPFTLPEWLIGLGVVAIVVWLVGYQRSYWLLLWSLIIMSLTMAVTYAIGLSVDARRLGFVKVGGKLQVVCGLLFASVCFLLLPSSAPDRVGENAWNHDGSAKAVTLAYWKSLGSLIEKCETAEERCKAAFFGNSNSSSQESPIDILRRQFVAVSDELNSLSLENVDPKAIEIGVEFDSLLLESINQLDEAMSFLKRQFTLGGLFQALLLGTDAEEAAMNESQQRLHDRSLRWEERVTDARIELSKKYGVTFPNLVAPNR